MASKQQQKNGKKKAGKMSAAKQEKMERLEAYDRDLKARIAAKSAAEKVGPKPAELIAHLEQEQDEAAAQAGAQAKAKAERKAAKAGRRTIKAAVIEIFSANPGATNAELTEAIKAEFPKSAFKASHASWYRQQLKMGKLTGTKVIIPPRQKAAPAAVAAS